MFGGVIVPLQTYYIKTIYDNNEFTISLIAQRMRIKQIGGRIIDRSFAIDNLQIKGDVPAQAKKIQNVLDQFYPNCCLVKIIPSEDLSKGYELYLLANYHAIFPVISSVTAILESDIHIAMNDFVVMNESNHIIAGLNNKAEAQSLINYHISKLKEKETEIKFTI